MGTGSSLRKGGILTPATMWRDPEDTGLRESSQTQKDPSCRSPLPGGPQRSPVYTDREERVGAGAGAGVGSPSFVRTESLCGGMGCSGDGGQGV